MRLLRSVATLLVVIVAGLALPFAGSAAGQPPVSDEVVQTQWGPMDAAARDMLVKVRLAGLWEGPAGQMGMEKSADPKVQEAGMHLVQGHSELDARVLELGTMLNVPLPTTPNSDQQGWLREMTAAPAGSAEFDKIYANRLRAAHGTVYKFIAQVRTGTRNTLIREFADQCMKTVLDHITVLEATGKVDFTDTKAIPIATPAAAAGAQPQAAGLIGGTPNSTLIMVIGGILIVITLVVLRVLLGGRSGQRFR